MAVKKVSDIKVGDLLLNNSGEYIGQVTALDLNDPHSPIKVLLQGKVYAEWLDVSNFTGLDLANLLELSVNTINNQGAVIYEDSVYIKNVDEEGVITLTPYKEGKNE